MNISRILNLPRNICDGPDELVHGTDTDRTCICTEITQTHNYNATFEPEVQHVYRVQAFVIQYMHTLFAFSVKFLNCLQTAKRGNVWAHEYSHS